MVTLPSFAASSGEKVGELRGAVLATLLLTEFGLYLEDTREPLMPRCFWKWNLLALCRVGVKERN